MFKRADRSPRGRSHGRFRLQFSSAQVAWLSLVRRCDTEPNKGQRGPRRGALQEKGTGLTPSRREVAGTKEAGSAGCAQGAGTRGGALDTWLCREGGESHCLGR